MKKYKRKVYLQDKPRKVVNRGTPLKRAVSLKPVSPVIDVEITVLDEDGKQVNVEKRTTKPAAQVNPLKKKAVSKIKQRRHSGQTADTAIELSDDDDDDEYQPPTRRIHKPAAARRRVVSSSDDDESDVEAVVVASRSSRLPLSHESPLPRTGSLAKRAKDTIPSPSATLESLQPSRSRSSLLPPAPKQKITEPAHPSAVSRASIIPSSKSIDQPLKPLPQIQRAISSDHAAAGRSKPRPLTPIRSRVGFLHPPTPPSPTTSDDLDDSLAFDFSEIEHLVDNIKEFGALSEPAWREAKQPAYLQPLLNECGQDAPHEFSAFIEMFPFDQIVQTSHNGVEVDTGVTDSTRTRAAFRKIGEASYSEVFGIGDVVLKIIPLRNEEASKSRRQGVNDVECPAPSDAKDVLKEVIVTKAMGQMCTGFIELLRTYIVRGKYPSLLLDLWDEYHAKKGSESVRPGNTASFFFVK